MRASSIESALQATDAKEGSYLKNMSNCANLVCNGNASIRQQ